jgi:hypothetical protein
MHDDLEQLLRRVPGRVPDPSLETSGRVRERVLRALLPHGPSRSAQRALLVAAVFLLVGGTGFGAGYWTGPNRSAADLTIGVRPDTISLEQLKRPVTLFGTVPSGRPGESVQIEANECGLSGFFHELEGVRTEGQGVWSLPIPGTFPNSKVNDYIHTKTTYRARWNNRVSDPVTVFVRSYVEFHQLIVKQKKKGKRLFAVNLGGRQIKYRPRGVVERRVGTGWKAAGKPLLSRGLTMLWLPAAKGQVLRVRLPDAEAAPCYLGAVSPSLRIR